MELSKAVRQYYGTNQACAMCKLPLNDPFDIAVCCTNEHQVHAKCLQDALRPKYSSKFLALQYIYTITCPICLSTNSCQHLQHIEKNKARNIFAFLGKSSYILWPAKHMTCEFCNTQSLDINRHLIYDCLNLKCGICRNSKVYTSRTIYKHYLLHYNVKHVKLQMRYALDRLQYKSSNPDDRRRTDQLMELYSKEKSKNI